MSHLRPAAGLAQESPLDGRDAHVRHGRVAERGGVVAPLEKRHDSAPREDVSATSSSERVIHAKPSVETRHAAERVVAVRVEAGRTRTNSGPEPLGERSSAATKPPA